MIFIKCERENPIPFRVGMKASTLHVNIKHTPNAKSDKNQHDIMSEPGKMVVSEI